MKTSNLRAAIGEDRWRQQCLDDLEIEADRARRSGIGIFPEHLLALTGRLQRLCVAMWATPQPILGEIAATWGAIQRPCQRARRPWGLSLIKTD